MLLARRLFLLATMAVAALAVTATAASAQPQVVTEPANEPCPDISIVAHIVTGGCHLEGPSQGDVTLHAYIPQKVTISRCEVFLEGRTDGNAEGYITNAILDPPHSGSVPCTRRPCAEPNGQMIPWPAHLKENGPGEEEIHTEFCVSSFFSNTGPWCEIHSNFTDLGNHQYQIGGQEEFCENNSGGYTGPHPILSPPISIESEIHTGGTGEGFELIH